MVDKFLNKIERNQFEFHFNSIKTSNNGLDKTNSIKIESERNILSMDCKKMAVGVGQWSIRILDLLQQGGDGGITFNDDDDDGSWKIDFEMKPGLRFECHVDMNSQAMKLAFQNEFIALLKKTINACRAKNGIASLPTSQSPVHGGPITIRQPSKHKVQQYGKKTSKRTVAQPSSASFWPSDAAPALTSTTTSTSYDLPPSEEEVDSKNKKPRLSVLERATPGLTLLTSPLKHHQKAPSTSSKNPTSIIKTKSSYRTRLTPTKPSSLSSEKYPSTSWEQSSPFARHNHNQKQKGDPNDSAQKGDLVTSLELNDVTGGGSHSDSDSDEYRRNSGRRISFASASTSVSHQKPAHSHFHAVDHTAKTFGQGFDLDSTIDDIGDEYEHENERERENDEDGVDVVASKNHLSAMMNSGDIGLSINSGGQLAQLNAKRKLDEVSPRKSSADAALDSANSASSRNSITSYLPKNPYSTGSKKSLTTFNTNKFFDTAKSRTALTGGLKNLGNTCYMNAALQALLALPCFKSDLTSMKLADFVKSKQQQSPGEGEEPATKKVKKDHPVYSALVEIAKAKDRKSSTPVSTTGVRQDAKDLKAAIDSMSTRFRGNMQQDAHEFFSDLLDFLHDELEGLGEEEEEKEKEVSPSVSDENENESSQSSANTATPKVNASQSQAGSDMYETPDAVDAPDTDERADPGVSPQDEEELREIRRAKHESLEAILPTSRNFGAELTVTLKCKSCHWSRSKAETYRHFSVDVNEGDNIGDCLKKFFTPCDVCIACEKCEHDVAVQSAQFSKLPRALVLHLKRFVVEESNSQFNFIKNVSKVEFSQSVDVSDYCAKDVASPPASTSTAAMIGRGLNFFSEKKKIDGEKDCEKKNGGDGSSPSASSSSSLASSKAAYNLQSIVHHIGKKPFSGHYVTDTIMPGNDKQWTHYDDSVANEISKDVVFGKQSQETAYILCYELK